MEAMVRFSPVSGTASCNGGDGEQLEEGGQSLFAEALALGVVAGGAFEDGLGDFEGDGGAAEVFVWVGAAGLVGVEDGEGFGDAFDAVGEMVVGDDEVEADAFGFGGGGEGADAGVDADD